MKPESLSSYTNLSSKMDTQSTASVSNNRTLKENVIKRTNNSTDRIFCKQCNEKFTPQYKHYDKSSTISKEHKKYEIANNQLTLNKLITNCLKAKEEIFEQIDALVVNIYQTQYESEDHLTQLLFHFQYDIKLSIIDLNLQIFENFKQLRMLTKNFNSQLFTLCETNYKEYEKIANKKSNLSVEETFFLRSFEQYKYYEKLYDVLTDGSVMYDAFMDCLGEWLTPQYEQEDYMYGEINKFKEELGKSREDSMSQMHGEVFLLTNEFVEVFKHVMEEIVADIIEKYEEMKNEVVETREMINGLTRIYE